ncbi:MAG: biopolymer transporter ExbD [Gammaproteobacteria bacterium]|jgi:biopolymer transport protein ExbD
MKNSRRIKRMSRNHKKKIPSMSLTSLMDVFTILVFFLLVNTANGPVLDPPKKVKLPDSVSDTKPAETAVVIVSSDNVLVQGRVVVSMKEVAASKREDIPQIVNSLKDIRKHVIGVSTKAIAESRKVTILSQKTIPYRLLQKVMSSCTMAGYDTINLAVQQESKKT